MVLAGCDTPPDQVPAVQFIEPGPWSAGTERIVSAEVDPRDTRVTGILLEWGMRSTIDNPQLIGDQDSVWVQNGQFRFDVEYPLTSTRRVTGKFTGAESLVEGNVVDYRVRVTYQRPPDYEDDLVFTSFSKSLVVAPSQGLNQFGLPIPGRVALTLEAATLEVGQVQP